MRSLDQITTLIVHHSASRRLHTMEEIRAWHLKKGWFDIGYHYVIEEDGSIRIGRPFGDTGAHCRKHNSHSLGVCLVGDNTVPGRAWLPVQVDSLKSLVVSLRLVLPNLTVAGHKDLAETLCPGVDIRSLLEEA